MVLTCTAAAASVVALSGIWILAAVLWPELPERIPLHFAAHGTPDRWGEATALNWFLLPGVATAMAPFFALVERLAPLLARRRPGLLNVPRRKEFVALPVDARVRALRPVSALLWGTPAPITGIFTYALWITHAVAMGRETGGTGFIIVTGAGVVAAVAWTAVCIVLTARAIREETRGASDAEPRA